MNYKLSTLCCVAACFLPMCTPLFGQAKTQDAAPAHEILGYLNPQTGVFRTVPRPAAQDSTEPPIVATVSGKIVVNFTITVESTIAATSKIGCNVNADVDDEGTGNLISESAGTAVLRGAGTTVACTATIPYSWKLGSASTDVIALSWTITSPVAIASGAAAYPIRVSSESLPALKVPATGTTTIDAVTATI